MDAEIFGMPGHLINRAARLLVRWGDARFRGMGLAIAQMPVLGALRDGGSLPQKELARLAQIEQPTMTQLLSRMERDGLIRRRPDPQDKRSGLISLSPVALKKLPRARTVLLQGNAEALEGFTDREIATLSRLLQRVVKNLELSSPDIPTEPRASASGAANHSPPALLRPTPTSRQTRRPRRVP